MATLVSLVGGQLAPIYLAHEHVKPERNILVHTAESRAQAEDLVAFFRDRYPECDFALVAVDAYDAESIRRKASDLLFSHPAAILNYTGGTKIMSVAFFTAFSNAYCPAVYVNTSDRKLLWHGHDLVEEHMATTMRIRDILNLQHPVTEVNMEHEDAYQLLNNVLFSSYKQRVKKDPEAEVLHKYRSKLAGKHRDHISREDWELNNAYLDVFVNGDTVEVDTDAGNWDFTKEDWLKYVTGGWFERWSYQRLKASGMFDDLAFNATIKLIQHTKDGLLNEIDVIGAKNAVLYLFECKSGRIDSSAVNNLVTSMKSYGGTISRGILLSLWPEKNFDENVAQRIKDNNISVIAGYKSLEDLSQFDISNLRKYAL